MFLLFTVIPCCLKGTENNFTFHFVILQVHTYKDRCTQFLEAISLLNFMSLYPLQPDMYRVVRSLTSSCAVQFKLALTQALCRRLHVASQRLWYEWPPPVKGRKVNFHQCPRQLNNLFTSSRTFAFTPFVSFQCMYLQGFICPPPLKFSLHCRCSTTQFLPPPQIFL